MDEDQIIPRHALDDLCGAEHGWSQWVANRIKQLIGVEGKSQAEAMAIIKAEEVNHPWRQDEPQPN